MKRSARFWMCALWFVLVGGLCATSVRAIEVTSIMDPTEATKVTLRDAINSVNGAGGTITFNVALFTAASPKTINLATALPALNNNITITGPGANAVTIRRDPGAATNFRIFTVNATRTVSISGVTISGGFVMGTTGI